jgi:S-adenosylmethionine hydrolase
MIYDIETEDVTKIDNFIKQTANDLELCITIIDKNGNVISSSEKNLYDIMWDWDCISLCWDWCLSADYTDLRQKKRASFFC